MTLKGYVRKFERTLRGTVHRRTRIRKLDVHIQKGLPVGLVEACRFIATRSYPDERSREVADAAEARRREIALSGADPIEIIYSPKPGSASDKEHPEEGARLLFSPQRVASTGKDQDWGSFLYLCARDAGARQVIELGACAGISTFYLASAPSVERLVTIEGSPALAEIASKTVAPFGQTVEVVPQLFNHALDHVLPEMPAIDLAYIDGHHEKVATIRYFERIRPNLRPGALVIFDDIMWSHDMREAWEFIISTSGFADCVDLGAVGVCLWDGKTSTARVWDLREVSGHTLIGNPHGWDRQEGELVN